MDDVMRELRSMLLADDAIKGLVVDRIGPEGEQSLAVLPAVTYLLTGGPAEEVLDFPAWKVDVWTSLDKPHQLKVLADAIDARLREKKVKTDAGRRVLFIERVTVWVDVPDADARHRSSNWSMVTI